MNTPSHLLERIATVNQDEAARYTDHEYDTFTGWNYMKARFSTPAAAGKFNRPDPARDWDWTTPGSLNLYQYVRNNPITGYDPTGLDYDVLLDKENHTIKIQAQIFIFGDAASEELAEKFQKNINDVWGAKTFEYKVEGEVYTVSVEATVSYDPELDESNVPVKELALVSDDNYVHVSKAYFTYYSEVHNGTYGKWAPDKSKYHEKEPDKIDAWDDPSAHEFGHMLGLDDRYYKDQNNPDMINRSYPGWEGNIMGGAEDGRRLGVEQRNIDAVLRPAIPKLTSGIMGLIGVKERTVTLHPKRIDGEL